METQTTNDESPEQAPSIDEMIDASASNDSRHSGPTLLDEMRIRIVDTTGEGNDGEADNASSNVVIGEPRKRGRPRGSSNGATTQAKTPARKKAEIAEDLERTKAELAAERARNDVNKIAELTKTIEMAAYFGFGIAASKRGPHWALKEDEAKDIAHSGAVALAPYTEAITKYAPGALFLGCLWKAVSDRVEQDARLVAALGPREQ